MTMPIVLEELCATGAIDGDRNALDAACASVHRILRRHGMNRLPANQNSGGRRHEQAQSSGDCPSTFTSFRPKWRRIPVPLPLASRRTRHRARVHRAADTTFERQRRTIPFGSTTIAKAREGTPMCRHCA